VVVVEAVAIALVEVQAVQAVAQAIKVLLEQVTLDLTRHPRVITLDQWQPILPLGQMVVEVVAAEP
jgi:hypothetical protein